MKYLVFACICILSLSYTGNERYGHRLNAKEIDLNLAATDLSSVPDDINLFRQAEKLKIRPDATKGWVIYPPVSASYATGNPENVLSAAVCDLAELRELDLALLKITALPACITNLGKLEKLVLSFNNLDIDHEIPKIQQLTSLREVYIEGNGYSKKAILNWQRANPSIEIHYSPNTPAHPYDDSVHNQLEKIIYRYYQTMSDRDWQAYREFFWPDATLTTIWQAPGDQQPEVHVSTIDDFIAGTAEGPDSQPIFEETPITIEIDIRGNLAIAWVSYEAKFGSEEQLMEWSGTDVFTWMLHGEEWRIVSLAYSSDG